MSSLRLSFGSSFSSFPASNSPVFNHLDAVRLQISQGLSRRPSVPVKITTASRLETRPAPDMVASGAAALDELSGGLPRGCLAEITGPASGGRTSLLLAALAAATQRQEACALVDASDAFDPLSGVAAGIEFRKLLWVRCGNKISRRQNTGKSSGEGPVEQALRVTDLLLQSGGFGLVAIDFGDVAAKTVRRVPLTTWFRFRRAVEPTPTVLLLITRVACAQTCSSLVLKVKAAGEKLPTSSFLEKDSFHPTHCTLLGGLQIDAELLRSRIERKPVRPERVDIHTSRMRAG